MTVWIQTVLTSEFFWGVIVGLILSVVGAYCLAVFTSQQQRRMQKEIVRNFCADTVNNLRQIVDDMSELRSKTKLIHADYLGLMDVEIQVFSRNREHTIHLPEQLRDRVRKFITDCAVRRAQIGNFLGEFSSRWRLADELQSQGQGPDSQRVRDEATKGPLANAHKALDELAVRAQESTTLINEIKNAA